jgi:hypothetical protein
LIDQIAANPMGIGNIALLPNYQNAQQRQAIIVQAIGVFTQHGRLSIQEISEICHEIAALAQDEREDVINHALELITAGMYTTDIREIIHQVAAIPRNERAAYVAARREHNGMAGGARAAAEGVNVHARNRDQKTREANANRVCNQGKTQRLAVAVLQGRLAGVNIDGLDLLTPADLQREFFSNEQNQKIQVLDTLINAAGKFLAERPGITLQLQDAFLEQVKQYARLEGIE